MAARTRRAPNPRLIDKFFLLASGIPRTRVTEECYRNEISMSHDVHQVRSFEHPGEGRRRAKSTPKGRQIEPQAAEEISLLLADRPRRRDLLIEHLHLIQDAYHQISAAHLAALADEMKLAFAEVFETATFYAHFDVVKEGETNIPPLTIRVCDSLTCAMLGRRPRSVITLSIMPVLQACSRPQRAATPTRICLSMSITTPMSPAAA